MEESQQYPLKGVVISLNTPFNEQRHIDFRSVERLAEMHLSEGAAGLLTSAQAGEVYELTVNERIDLLRCVREVTARRAELIVGATARDQRESFRLAEAAVRLGCDGVLIEVPDECRSDRQAIVDFVVAFADLGMPMLMIQDLDWEGVGLEVDLIAELFERIENFRCLKVEVTPAGPKYSAVLEATGNRLHISGGWASLQMIEALDRGVLVFMPSAMAGLFDQAIKYYLRGERMAAKEWFHKLLPVLAFTRQHLDISIQFHKRLFHRRGVISTQLVRKRTIPYDAWHERYGEELMDYLDHVESEVCALRVL